jgi:Cu/Zn superoxide dismutase
MKVKAFLIIAVLGTATGLAFAPGSNGAEKTGDKPITVRLTAQNKSGESGSAKLTPQGDQTKVEVSLKGTPKGVQQPAHIHEGSCAKLDPKPKYGLESITDGKSTTVVPVSIDTLLAGKMAINVHKSGEDLKTYVACGDIKRSAAKKKK